MEDIAREKFFSIIRSLVGILKESTEKAELKSVISALKWKFTARDHGQLRSLDLFKILHEGNGS